MKNALKLQFLDLNDDDDHRRHYHDDGHHHHHRCWYLLRYKGSQRKKNRHEVFFCPEHHHHHDDDDRRPHWIFFFNFAVSRKEISFHFFSWLDFRFVLKMIIMIEMTIWIDTLRWWWTKKKRRNRISHFKNHVEFDFDMNFGLWNLFISTKRW